MKYFLFLIFFLTYNLSYCQVGKSLVLDGRGNFYEIAHNADLNFQGGMTIEFWIRANCVDNVLIATKQRCNGEFGYSLGIVNGKLRWILSSDGFCNGNSMYETDNAVITADQFTHVALVQNQTSVSIYIDGSLVNGRWTLGNAISPRNSTRPLLIGAYTGIAGGQALYFSGLIDEFRIWKTALTSNQINQRKDMSINGNEQDLVLYFDMEHSTQGSNAKLINKANSGTTLDGNVRGSTNNTPYFMNESNYVAFPFQLPDTISSCINFTQNTTFSTYYHTLRWNDNTTNPNKTLSTTGLYWLEIERERCKFFRDSMYFNYGHFVKKLNDEICRGKSISFGNQNILQPGLYYDTILVNGGCDTFIELTVTLNPDIQKSLTFDICKGDSIVFGNKVFKTQGLHLDTISSNFTCDTIVEITINFLPPIEKLILESLCEGKMLNFGNQNISQPGIYYDTILVSSGCDTAVQLTVSMIYSTDTSINLLSCDGEPVIFLGNTFHFGIDTTLVLINHQGCDSFIYLSIVNEYKGEFLADNFTTCELTQTLTSPSENTVWNTGPIADSITIYETGQYYGTYIDEEGCSVNDSIFVTFINGNLFLPSAFSPNQDAINECFKPLINSGTEIKNYQFTIFNRWGEKIFYTNQQTDCWDGKVKNKLVQDGIYLFLVTGFIDDCEKIISEKGLVHLVK